MSAYQGVRYSIHKHPLWQRWYVRAHFAERASVCGWFDDWNDAVGFVVSVFGWQW